MTPSLDWLWYGFAAALALAGLWFTYTALFRDRARGRRRCPRCWYSMEGIPSTTCPECGHDARTERRLLRTRRRWPRALAAAGLLAAALTIAALPYWLRGDWVSLVPTSVLVEVAGPYRGNVGWAPPRGLDVLREDLSTEALKRWTAGGMQPEEARRWFARSILAMGITPEGTIAAPRAWPRSRPMPVTLNFSWPAIYQVEYLDHDGTWWQILPVGHNLPLPPGSGPAVFPVRFLVNRQVVYDFDALPGVSLVADADEVFDRASGPRWDARAAAVLAPSLVFHGEWRLRIGGPMAPQTADEPDGVIFACDVEVEQDGEIIATTSNTGAWNVRDAREPSLTRLRWTNLPFAHLDPARITLRLRGGGEPALRTWEPISIGAPARPVAWFGTLQRRGDGATP